ncbi:hypothetical protein ACFWVM_29220 [Nocardia fluminea]|uniref:hypothetical protein n=1 Tax=Nocardia fluminea TaxID=134984 RepID=UPI00365E7E6C
MSNPATVEAVDSNCQTAVIAAMKAYAAEHGRPGEIEIEGELAWDDSELADFLTCTLKYLTQRRVDLGEVLDNVERHFNEEVDADVACLYLMAWVYTDVRE